MNTLMARNAVHEASNARFRRERLFPAGMRAEEAFSGEEGFLPGPSFSHEEVERIHALIRDRLHQNARAAGLAAAGLLDGLDLARYHEVADRLDHRSLLSKQGRILDRAAVEEIKGMSPFQGAAQAFGEDWSLSDEEGVGHEQICFRLVRPSVAEDIGSLHRDAWFWEHFDWPVPAGFGRAKVWAPIRIEPGRAGLLLWPGSHLEAAPYRVENQGGKMAFHTALRPGKIALIEFQGGPGDSVLFNYGLLHVGSLNRSAITRVSIEFTVLFRQD